MLCDWHMMDCQDICCHQGSVIPYLVSEKLTHELGFLKEPFGGYSKRGGDSSLGTQLPGGLVKTHVRVSRL